MLDKLVERFGLGAIVVARPYVGSDGETLRWVIQIDGHDLNDVDVRLVEDPEQDRGAVFLVCGHEEVELGRWRLSRDRYGPAQLSRTLRDLTRSPR